MFTLFEIQEWHVYMRQGQAIKHVAPVTQCASINRSCAHAQNKNNSSMLAGDGVNMSSLPT